VDPGSFAAPGGPLLVIQDVSALRITATAAPEAVRGIARGQEIDATIEGMPVRATVEGVVPAAGGSLYTVNAIVPNRDGRMVVRGSATLSLPQGTRSTFVVPRTAIITRADMTGVYLQREGQQLLRWVRVGPAAGDSVEILSGVRDGDVLIIPGAK
jgi:membrane fusion protein, multidrug efflux system